MRKMKSSGVEWIGDIPQEWEVSRIGYLFSERKVKVSDKEYEPLSVTMQGIVPQLSTAAKTDAHDDRKLVCNGDFVINSRSDRRGSCGISKYDGSVSLINIVLKPRIEISQQYYNWLFKSSAFSDEFYKWGHGIVDDLWTTNWQDMKHIYISLLPLPEQQRIAEFLDRKCAEIDSIIAKTKATIEQYKALKQSVITQAVTKGIRPDRPMKDSGIEWIGEIPQEWNCNITKRFCTFKTGSTPSTANQEWFDGELNWFTPSDFNESYYLSKSSRALSVKAKQDNVATIIPNNTVMIIGIGGTAGKIGLTMCECSCNQQITALINSPRLLSKYLMYWMIANTKYLKETALFTTLPIINNQTIGSYPIIVPSDLSEQQEIADYLDSKCAEIDRLIAAKEQLLTELESYKKSVIYEYVTGKKEV